jgi:TetR/AcrR family transcriptional regulator, cholesterol catabolism regulator
MAQAPARTRSPRRAEMTKAAARLFSERGYHGTSMKDLGQALGLLRGSLYAHIASKQELLLDVVESGAEAFLDRARQVSEMTAPASERLEEFLVGHVETAIAHLDASTVFLNEWRYLSDELRDTIRDKRDRYEQTVRDIIADGIATGEFRSDLDVRLAATLVLSAGNWVYTWYRPEGELSPTEIGRRFADMIVAGLKGDAQ